MRQPQTSLSYYHTLPDYVAAHGAEPVILMYHKVALRPRGVRLRGLYVEPDLFTRQCGEWQENGWSTAGLAELARGAEAGPKKVILTFDDGFRNVWKNAARPLAHAGFSAILFLVADLIGQHNAWEVAEGEVREPLMEGSEIRDWLELGHEIGAHTLTHPHLTQISPACAREEIVAGKKKLEDEFGVCVRHFCYPYGDWNQAVRDLAEEAGYETACTTQQGLVSRETDRFALPRFTVRHATRNLRTLWQSFRRRIVR